MGLSSAKLCRATPTFQKNLDIKICVSTGGILSAIFADFDQLIIYLRRNEEGIMKSHAELLCLFDKRNCVYPSRRA